MSEEIFVRHCSPTLAGIKTANLFTCRFENEEEMNNRALMYAYRSSRLSQDLRCHDDFMLLKKRGYTGKTPECCLVQLVQKLRDGGEFPHEIGLFLGYPAEDVCGFIENKAEGY